MNQTPPPPTAAPPANLWRRWLIALVAVLVAVLIGAGVIVLRAYDHSNTPDLGSPEVAISEYLDALLNQRDDAAAAKYACADQTGLAPIRAYRDLVVGRVESQDATVTFSWTLVVHRGADRSAVATDLGATSEMQGTPISSHTTWNFIATRDGGAWRACSVAQATPSPSSGLSPTPSLGP